MLVTAMTLILALLAWLSSSSAASAEPISTAIGLTLAIETAIGATTITVAGATITAAAIGGAIVSTALSIGASLLAAHLAKSQTATGEPATESGVQTSIRLGADVPRNRVFGKQMLAGQLVYWNLYGPDNKWLQLVFVLGSGPHDLFRVFGDGKPLTLGALEGTTGFPIQEYSYGSQPLGWVYFHPGYDDQAVDAELVSGAVPPGRWSSANVGKGVCYVRLTLFYFPEVFKQGIPSFGFEVGARVYDPRLDGSSGGVGAHRWSDQHTWAWSDNPAVIAYNFERGLYIGSQRVLGRGLAPVDMVRTMYVDAANVCDELVALNAGGTEKRYRIGINVGADRDLKSIQQELMIAMAGAMVEVGGAFGPLAGAAKEAVAVLTDDDFVTGKVIRFSQKKPRDQIMNALFGSFTDPAQNYQAVPYAPRTSSSDEAEDGDRFQVRRDYVMIQSQTQAQRVGEIERRDARYQGSAAGTLPFKYSYLEAGDWIQWTSARRSFDKYFRIKSHRLAADQTIELALDETDPEVFDFDPAIDELDPLHPGDLPGIGDLILMVPDFSIAALQVNGAGGLIIPALRALWSPITDRTVDDVIVQYRLGTDDTTIKIAQPFRPIDGEGIITDGVQAGTGYQARATMTSTPARPMLWTSWVAITAPVQHVIPKALTSTTSASADAVAAANIIGQIVGTQIQNAAITAAKLALQSITATNFATGIQPVQVATSAPTAPTGNSPLTYFNSTDKKLYRWNGSAWIASTAAVDITGTLTDSQIADLQAAKLTGTITTTQITDSAVTTAKIFAGAVTTASLAAGAVTTAKLAVGTASNMIPNSDLIAGLAGWSHSLGSGLAPGAGAGWYTSDPWRPFGFYAYQIWYSGGQAPANGTIDLIQIQNPTLGGAYAVFAVKGAGGQYEFSLYCINAANNARVVINWHNSSMTLVGQSVGNLVSAATASQNLKDWNRSFVIATVPANAVYAALYLQMTYTGAVNPFVFATAAYFGPASPNQTEPSEWTPAGVTTISGGRIVTDSITAQQIAAGTITAAEIFGDTITGGQIAAGAINTAELVTGAVTAGIIGAGAVTTTKLAVGTGSSNRAYNSDFLGGLAGVSIHVQTVALPVDLGIYGPPYSAYGMMSAAFSYVGTPPNGTVTDFKFQMPKTTAGGFQDYPITPGKRYEASVYLSAHRCTGNILLWWMDSAGAEITSVPGNVVTTAGSNTLGGAGGLERSVAFGTAPANAVTARLSVRGSYSGLASPFMFATGFYFADANVNQTEPTPWGPSGNTVINGGQIVTNSITADKILANSITAGQLSTGTLITVQAQMGASTIGTAQIRDLEVDNIKIRNASICSANMASGGGVAFGQSTDTIIVSTSVTFRAPAGAEVIIQAQYSGACIPNNSGCSWRMTIVGVQVAVNGVAATTTQYIANLIGAYRHTATGGDETRNIVIRASGDQPVVSQLQNNNLFAVAYQR